MATTLNGSPISEIDSVTSLGLGGAHNSIGYRVAEIERHLHSGGRWFETAAVASGETHVADAIGTGGGAFQIDAGDDAWGTWVQVLGSDDTPSVAGKAYFDPHQMIVEAVERAFTYFMQLARGASGAAAISAGTYTEFVYASASTRDTAIIEVQTGRAPAGSKVWARCMCPGQNTATLDFYIGLHEYEG